MERNIVTDFSYGVYAVTAFDGKNVGCIANCAMQITAEPATFAVSINHDNRTHLAIKSSGKFAVSVLAESSDPAIIRTFGFKSSKDVNKFDGIDYEMKDGLPVLRDTCGFIVCEVIDTMETPTHTVFLGKLIADGVFSDREPMTYAYYHKVIKGSSPEKAPTYIPPEKRTTAAKEESGKKTKKFVCSVCGYVYEGDELPEDFVCPVCGMGADVFFEEDKPNV